MFEKTIIIMNNIFASDFISYANARKDLKCLIGLKIQLLKK